jgi:hypothetical protein
MDTETKNDQDDQERTGDSQDLDAGEHYFPAVRVQSGGRLGLDSDRMKRNGFEEGDRVDIAIPGLDLYLPEVRIQTQYRVQIPSRHRENNDIEDGTNLDVFVIEET